ncbi:HAD family hydrolase [Runella slithyformis]|uniref:HAD-superfamily hydrolase, subfamily IA, variant 3 n=1 Tax=Runella slithyformis (strain ATCC 29530 / DSM 19594 / LMG 11500 / NCIMB 11436 / LSU 4) TaxID=761193 RepID=A0A7U3ZHI2_RUNSL|nr:HAD family hydrolase [Runella slithyformis]AEI47329.1 HAD-superfamily hydrolase, subfamily IA, variant 3 [Runella slithyformis DSM 19594]
MIKGVLLDYGGTIDTNGLHWGGVLWESYRKYKVPIDRETFSKAYSFGERALAIHPIVKPAHTFLDTLRLKIEQQFLFLRDNGWKGEADLMEAIAADCHLFAKTTVAQAAPVLEQLAKRGPLVMVSNFYGNIHSVLRDFGIDAYFSTVVESAVVGVRKPDPAIYQLGVDALQLPAQECVVIGDSYSKDIVPGHETGCKTIWLNVQGWEDTDRKAASVADLEINNFASVIEAIEALSR